MQSRLPNDHRQEEYFLAYDHAQLTDDLTVKLDKIPAGKRVRIDSVQYINPTGLAEDTTNVFALSLKNGSTVMASWSTDSDLLAADASIPADTFMSLTLSATDANLILAGGDVLSLFFDEGGSATLPPGRIVIRGRYV